MVGFVFVSHSQKLAEGAKELGLMMAEGVPAEAAGGTADGSLGTDYEKIRTAIDKVAAASPEGVVVMADMGSSCMTAEMVLEDRGDVLPKVVLASGPFVEGTVTGMVGSSLGQSLEEVLTSIRDARRTDDDE